ncbi:SPRY-domain-containing protein [Gigaspora margarita]|uniref:SPRY-domain-containing protein n=1 Tax=Gigaspora margarita TaxID=4874 RepID=A0A8H4ATU4_GIGMA|nr:SPRY-domain-containing protein [Gigaspora margarita]
MDPITMNANNDKSTVLNVDSGVLRINYAGGENSEDAIVRANNPIPSQCEMFYFEVDIINNEKNGIIAIGFCEQSVELNKLPGCAIADDDIDDQLKEKWVKVLKHCNEDTIKDFMDKLNSMEINQKNMLECRAKVYFIIGSYKEALDDLNKLLKMEENSVFALRYRRETYFLLCEQKQSNADLKRLLKKDDKWALQVNEEINGDRR